jgi:MoaA/NifB/PqqE/SkfB family radical SAM enzyme
MGMRDAGELLPGRDVVELFRAADDDLTFVSPSFATYQRQNGGELRMTLRRLSPATENAGSPASGPFGRLAGRIGVARARQAPSWSDPLAELTVPCDSLVDNDAVDFPIPHGKVARGDLLALTISANATRSGSAPTVWLADDGNERMPGHLGCYVGGTGQDNFGTKASALYGGLTAKRSVPRVICYSPVTQCNLNCIHCISRHTRNAKHQISGDIKEQLQAWCRAGQVDYITTDYSGDILWADHRFGGELDFLIGLNVPFHIDTSGSHLFPGVSERLCHSRLETINISLDAAHDETYRRIRKGAPALRDVVENIEALMAARAAASVDFEVSMSFTLMRSNLGEWLDFIRMAARLGVHRVFARHLEAYTPDMEKESLWHDQAGFNQVRLDAIALADSLGMPLSVALPFGGKAGTARKPCAVPWNDAIILGNGDVAACCIPGLVMGNLNENTMQEIWNGPKYRELRATVNSDNPPPTCAACPIYGHNDNQDSHLVYSALKRRCEKA